MGRDGIEPSASSLSVKRSTDELPAQTFRILPFQGYFVSKLVHGKIGTGIWCGGEVETLVSAKHRCAGSIPARTS